MISRAKEIINREKLKQPERPGAVLLLSRLWYVLVTKFTEKWMELKKDSTFLSSEDLFMCSLFPKRVLDLIIIDLKPTSVLDVGCGTGAALQYFSQFDIDGVGVENSKAAIAQSKIKNRIVRFNLKKELFLGRQFDLVWCFEVIEHIHPKFEYNFLLTLTNHSSTIILSAAKPGQGGRGHFNEQFPEYWIEKFATLSYVIDPEFTEKLRSTQEIYSDNLLCFKKVG